MSLLGFGGTWLPGLPTPRPWSLSPDLGPPPPALSFLFPSQGQRRTQEPPPDPARTQEARRPIPTTPSVSLSPTPSHAVPARGVLPLFPHRALRGPGSAEPQLAGRGPCLSPACPLATWAIPALQATAHGLPRCHCLVSKLRPAQQWGLLTRPDGQSRRLSSPSVARLGSSQASPVPGCASAWCCRGFAFPENTPESQSQGLQKVSQAQPSFKKHHEEFLLDIQHDAQPGW